jgi:hypothetical protein
MRSIECEMVCCDATAAACTSSITASTASPSLASSTKRRRWAVLPPISRSWLRVLAFSVRTSREMRRRSGAASASGAALSSPAICSR